MNNVNYSSDSLLTVTAVQTRLGAHFDLLLEVFCDEVSQVSIMTDCTL